MEPLPACYSTFYDLLATFPSADRMSKVWADREACAALQTLFLSPDPEGILQDGQPAQHRCSDGCCEKFNQAKDQRAQWPES